jgi:hypothetical protein
MDETSRDTPLRLAAFDHMRRLAEVHDHLTATELKPGFVFEGERIPLMNPQRGIFTLVVVPDLTPREAIGCRKRRGPGP